MPSAANSEGRGRKKVREASPIEALRTQQGTVSASRILELVVQSLAQALLALVLQWAGARNRRGRKASQQAFSTPTKKTKEDERRERTS